MYQLIISIIVVAMAAVLFMIAKKELELPFGFRTYWPVFVALFFYCIYATSIFLNEQEKKLLGSDKSRKK